MPRPPRPRLRTAAPAMIVPVGGRGARRTDGDAVVAGGSGHRLLYRWSGDKCGGGRGDRPTPPPDRSRSHGRGRAGSDPLTATAPVSAITTRAGRSPYRGPTVVAAGDARPFHTPQDTGTRAGAGFSRPWRPPTVPVSVMARASSPSRGAAHPPRTRPLHRRRASQSACPPSPTAAADTARLSEHMPAKPTLKHSAAACPTSTPPRPRTLANRRATPGGRAVGNHNGE